MDTNNTTKLTTQLGEVKILMLKGEKGDTGEAGVSGDYSGLTNKPSINNVTLDGNKTSDDLNLASQTEVSQMRTYVDTEVSNMESYVEGKMATVYAFQGRLTSESFLSTLKDIGIYYYTSNNYPSDVPSGYDKASIVEVIGTPNGGLIQRITRFGYAGTSTWRVYTGEEWTVWSEIATKYRGSQQISGSFMATAYTAANGRDLYVLIPLNRPTATNVSMPYCTRAVISLRTVDGTFAGGSVSYDASSYIAGYNLMQNGMYLLLRGTGANFWGVANQTPLTGVVEIEVEFMS